MTVDAVKENAISQGTRDRYTDIKQAVVSLLRYSQGLEGWFILRGGGL